MGRCLCKHARRQSEASQEGHNSMKQSIEKRPKVLGFDVGKSTITVYDDASERLTSIENTPSALHRFLKPYNHADTFAICEATGGYEAALLDA